MFVKLQMFTCFVVPRLDLLISAYFGFDFMDPIAKKEFVFPPVLFFLENCGIVSFVRNRELFAYTMVGIFCLPSCLTTCHALMSRSRRYALSYVVLGLSIFTMDRLLAVWGPSLTLPMLAFCRTVAHNLPQIRLAQCTQFLV